MGTVLTYNSFLLANLEGLSKPIIYCYLNTDLVHEAVSLNRRLTIELAKIPSNRRTIQLEKCLYQAIVELPNDVVLKNIDVMFNPAYKVDILKLLITVYKKKHFSIIWPGTYLEGKLVYADESYTDYRSFDISEYDVTCIV